MITNEYFSFQSYLLAEYLQNYATVLQLTQSICETLEIIHLVNLQSKFIIDKKKPKSTGRSCLTATL